MTKSPTVMAPRETSLEAISISAINPTAMIAP